MAAASSTYPAGQLNLVAPGGPLTIPKNGYLYIWVSNETQGWDVFFDNLSVQYKQGPVLEENHYYPFGLTQAGISDKAIKTQYAENKYRYDGGAELQNKEFSDGSGLELYETNLRNYDPQIGRFFQMDPMADVFHFVSTYQFALDNPVLCNDPSGAEPIAAPTFQNAFHSGLEIAQLIDQAFQNGDNSIFLFGLNGDGSGGGGGTGGGGTSGGVSDDGATSPNYSNFWNNFLSFALAKIGNAGELDFNFLNVGDDPSRIRINYNYTDPATQLPFVVSKLFNVAPGGPTDPHKQELQQYGQVVFGTSIIATAAGIKGFTVEFGQVVTDKGWVQNYHTVYNTRSIALALTFLNYFHVSSKPGYQTTFSDWAGPTYELGGNYGVVSVSWGWSTSYTTWSFGLGPGLTLPTPGTGAYMVGTTYLDGAPYPATSNSPITDGYFRSGYY